MAERNEWPYGRGEVTFAPEFRILEATVQEDGTRLVTKVELTSVSAMVRMAAQSLDYSGPIPTEDGRYRHTFTPKEREE
jgi:hypothetical protein